MLAISGQHLVILAAFVWVVLKVLGVRRRQGCVDRRGRDDRLHAADRDEAFCRAGSRDGLSAVCCRDRSPAAGDAGECLRSGVDCRHHRESDRCIHRRLPIVFLIRFRSRFEARGSLAAPRPLTPVEQLIEESRTATAKMPFAPCHANAIWLAIAISFVILGVVNGTAHPPPGRISCRPSASSSAPPLVLLTSIALVAGFMLLLVSPVGIWLGWPFAQVTQWSLAGCDLLVRLRRNTSPVAWVYAPAPFEGRLARVGFYLSIAGWCCLPAPWPRRVLVVACSCGSSLGLAVASRPSAHIG